MVLTDVMNLYYIQDYKSFKWQIFCQKQYFCAFVIYFIVINIASIWVSNHEKLQGKT